MKLRIAAILIAAFLAGGQAAPDRNFQAPDHSFQECPECPPMVGIAAGKFLMGSPAREPGRFDSEGPQHAVTVKAFALAKYPVSSAEFLAFLNATGYQPQPCNSLLGLGWRQLHRGQAATPTDVEPPRWPAVCLDWKDAEAYIAWLNARARAARPQLGNRNPYRLPSEAEWEYAARAGTHTARWWGEEIGGGHANCNGCGSEWDNKLLGPVDAFEPNPFGLSGMLGNAWEWTADCWHPSYVGAPVDGRAWTDSFCIRHAIRGGAWNNVPIFVRSAARVAASENGADQDYDYSTLTGFRMARDLP
jgi:formylglycine-generating enzyme required for sulfatase activity